MQPAPSRLRQRLAALCFGTLLALGVLAVLDQVALRSRFFRAGADIRSMTERSSRQTPPYFQLRPGTDTTFTSWSMPPHETSVHINALGFRDSERRLEKPRDVSRIVALGDSITFGLGVEVSEALPAQLETAIRRQGFPTAEVWNAGTPAHAMADHAATLRERLLVARPDVVLLQICENDAVVPYRPPDWLAALGARSAFASLYLGYRTTAPDDLGLFLASLRDVFDSALHSGAHVVVWLLGQPGDSRDRILRMAAEQNIEVIAVNEEVPRLAPDDAHLSAEGSRQTAEAVLPAVLRLLASPASAKTE